MATLSNEQTFPEIIPDLPNMPPRPLSREPRATTAISFRRPVLETVLKNYADYVGRFIGIAARTLRGAEYEAQERARNA